MRKKKKKKTGSLFFGDCNFGLWAIGIFEGEYKVWCLEGLDKLTGLPVCRESRSHPPHKRLEDLSLWNLISSRGKSLRGLYCIS